MQEEASEINDVDGLRTPYTRMRQSNRNTNRGGLVFCFARGGKRNQRRRLTAVLDEKVQDVSVAVDEVM